MPRNERRRARRASEREHEREPAGRTREHGCDCASHVSGDLAGGRRARGVHTRSAGSVHVECCADFMAGGRERMAAPARSARARCVLCALLVAEVGIGLHGVAATADLRGRQLSSYTIKQEDRLNTDKDPWTPCNRTTSAGVERGYCRLSCTARWAYAPHLMDCEMLPQEDLYLQSHSRGVSTFRQMSSDSFSNVNSGPSDPDDPDVL